MQIQLDLGLFKAVALARAKKDPRFYLNGVLLEAEGSKLFIVATDGRRLHFGVQNLSEPTSITIILDETCTANLLKIKSPFAEIDLSSGSASADGLQIRLTLEAGVYPNWRQVIKKGPSGPEENRDWAVNPSYLADLQAAAKHLGQRALKQQGVAMGRRDNQIIATVEGRSDFGALIMERLDPRPVQLPNLEK